MMQCEDSFSPDIERKEFKKRKRRKFRKKKIKEVIQLTLNGEEAWKEDYHARW